MAMWKPDPTFYPSPRLAMQGPAERLAYVAMLNVEAQPKPDAMGVVDLDPASATYGTVLGRVDMPGVGDELHHFGWNACSSALCPYAPHPHVERRYLLVPGLRSSRMSRDGRQARSAQAADRQHDRAGGDRAPHRLHAARTRCTAGRTGST